MPNCDWDMWLDAIEMRRLSAARVGQREIAAQFGVSRPLVSMIVNFKIRATAPARPGMQICTRCNKAKPLDAFQKAPPRQARSGRSSHCKDCVSLAGKAKREANPGESARLQREDYARDPAKHRAKMKVYKTANADRLERARILKRREVRTALNAIKVEAGCLRCGMTDPRCIHFHHRNPNTKSNTIGEMVTSGVALPRILAEIKKCDPMCANCHMILHAEERVA